jgi:hypothetical protein
MMGWKYYKQTDATTKRWGLVAVVLVVWMNWLVDWWVGGEQGRLIRDGTVAQWLNPDGDLRCTRRAGDSNLATLSASSPVLREKKERDKESALVHSLCGAFGASDAASIEAGRCFPSFRKGSHPRRCMVCASGDSLDVFIWGTLLT